ncbi:MAG: cyclic nucleotide-binding domain-containing protein [Vampirovibrionales bacterium]|nr:cyclic nucleotide-binding domain-containing protein [Vampirovibrionales bacterium]
MFVTKNFVKGETIFKEGDLGDRTFHIIKGEVLICKNRRDGGMVAIGKLGVGEIFGEMYLFDPQAGGRRSATAIAACDAEVEVIFEETLTKLMADMPPQLGSIMEALCRRLRKLSGDYAMVVPVKKYSFIN